MNTRPSVLSLFAGIGGICTAFNNAGCDICLANERDRYACETYRNSHDFPLLEEDVVNLHSNAIRDDVDIVVGGFPCQPFSQAGDQLGFDDPKGRGLMFFEITRIIDELTDDGRKKVSSDSISDEFKNKLEDRFMELDYRHFILPWLKENVFPVIPNKDFLLSAAAYQYIDYLEGRYGIRERDYKMETEKIEKIKNFLKNELKLNENDNIEFAKGINDFQNELDNAILEVQKEHDLLELLMSDIYPQMKKDCNQDILTPRFWTKAFIYQKNVFVLDLKKTVSNSPINEVNLFLDTYAECRDDQYYLCFSIGKRCKAPEYNFNKATLDYVSALDSSWSYDENNIRIRKEILWDKRYSRLPRSNDKDGMYNFISEIFEEIRKGLIDELGLIFVTD